MSVGAQRARVRRHRFPGAVLAASCLGGRLVALVARDGLITAGVVGKRLASVEQISIPFAEVGLTVAHVDAIAESGLAPLYFESGSLLWHFDDRWWSLPPAAAAQPAPWILAVGVGRTIDQPVIARRWRPAGGVRIVNTGKQVPDYGELRLGAPGVLAYSRPNAATTWTVIDGNAERTVEIDADARVIAVVATRPHPSLLTVSRSGRILRLADGQTTKTLTRWSDCPDLPAIHPTEPIAAVRRASGTVEVSDIESGRVLTLVRGDA